MTTGGPRVADVLPSRPRTDAALRVGRPGVAMLGILVRLGITSAVLARAWLMAPPTWVFAAVGVVCWAVGVWGLARWLRRPTRLRLTAGALQVAGLGWRRRVDLASVRQVTVRDREIYSPSADRTARRALLVIDVGDGPRPQRIAVQVTAAQRNALLKTQAFAAALSDAADVMARQERRATDTWTNATDAEGMRWVNADVGSGSGARVLGFVVSAVVLILLWIFTMVYAAAGPRDALNRALGDRPSASTVTAHLRGSIAAGSRSSLPVVDAITDDSVCGVSQPWLWGELPRHTLETTVRVRSSQPDDLVNARSRAEPVTRLTDRLSGVEPRGDTATHVYVDGQVDGVAKVRVVVDCVKDGTAQENAALRDASAEAARAVLATVLQEP